MERILFLSTSKKEESIFSFIKNNKSIIQQWNEFDKDAEYDSVFYLIQSKNDLDGLLEKYNFLKNNNASKIVVFLDEIIIQNLPNLQGFQGIISLQVLRDLLAQKLNVDTVITFDGIFFKVKNRLEKIIFKEIVWIQAKDIYSIIKTTEARYLVSHSLREIDEKLKPFQIFQRIHRSYIINLSRIEAIEDRNALVSGEYLPIGQAYRDELYQKLLFI